MARKKSIVSQLYKISRDSNNLRAASRGPAALAKRQVRRKVYSKGMGLTGKLLQAFGMQGNRKR